MDAPGPGGLIVAFAQVIEYLLVEFGAAAGAGVLDGPVRLAEDRDDVAGPVLDAAGAEFHDCPAAPDNVLGALLDAGEPGQEVLVAGVAVGDEVPGEGGGEGAGDAPLRREAMACRNVSRSSGVRTIRTCGEPAAVGAPSRPGPRRRPPPARGRERGLVQDADRGLVGGEDALGGERGEHRLAEPGRPSCALTPGEGLVNPPGGNPGRRAACR